MPSDTLTRGRGSYARHAWRDAYEELSAVEGAGLPPADVERLAVAAHLLGRDAAADEAFERAFHAYCDDGRPTRAVRCGFWFALTLFQRGQHAQGGGWLSRCRRLLDQEALDCVEQGYLLLPVGLGAMAGGDPATAYATYVEASRCATRFDDPDLVALSRLGCGQALTAMGETREGVALLDEAMLAVTTGDVSPIAAGTVYCAVIIACRQTFDLRRAQEWTETMSRWCAGQQDLKPYRGQCLVHRSEVLQLRGAWAEALDVVQQACRDRAGVEADPVLGMARYQQAELLRLRGQLARAEECYRAAGECGHPVQPGLALLRLDQGRVDDAAAAVRRVMSEAAEDEVARSRVLAAAAEVLLAAGDVTAARSLTGELDDLAERLGSPQLRALAAYARGAVELADGDAGAACLALQRAAHGWQELAVPYEAARTHLLLARACRDLGDSDTADVELGAARRVFEQLGAAPALALLDALAGGSTRGEGPGGLTPREVEVLAVVATGATNREVGDALVISERTVGRHLNNIFVKIGVSSRAAATAYAYEHHIV